MRGRMEDGLAGGVREGLFASFGPGFLLSFFFPASSYVYIAASVQFLSPWLELLALYWQISLDVKFSIVFKLREQSIGLV